MSSIGDSKWAPHPASARKSGLGEIPRKYAPTQERASADDRSEWASSDQVSSGEMSPIEQPKGAPQPAIDREAGSKSHGNISPARKGPPKAMSSGRVRRAPRHRGHTGDITGVTRRVGGTAAAESIPISSPCGRKTTLEIGTVRRIRRAELL